MRETKHRAEIETLRQRAVPTSKDLDLDSFVSRQDMHLHEKRTKIAEKRASKEQVRLSHVHALAAPINPRAKPPAPCCCFPLLVCTRPYGITRVPLRRGRHISRHFPNISNVPQSTSFVH